MYSPKIKPKYIPQLYHMAKRISGITGKKYPMTKLVNELIEYFLMNKEKIIHHRAFKLSFTCRPFKELIFERLFLWHYKNF